jgi:ribosomal protein S6
MALMENDESKELETELRVYEVGYLLLPYIQEADIAAEAGHIKEAIIAAGGNPFAEENPRLLTLAYPMYKVFSNKKTKFENAYFGWIKFDGEPKSVLKLKKTLDAEEKVLRFLITKTVRENTLVRKTAPFASKPIKPAVKEVVKEDEPKEVINEEELDKTIEDLILE